MGVYRDLRDLRDATASEGRRREACDAILPLVERYASWTAPARSGSASAEDIAQDTVVRLLTTDIAGRVQKRNPDADEPTLDKLCSAYMRSIANTASYNVVRAKKGEIIDPGPVLRDPEGDGVLTLIESPFAIVTLLYEFVRESEVDKARANLERTWGEICALQQGTTTLDEIVSAALERPIPSNRRSDLAWKREYDKICSQHARFRDRLRSAAGDLSSSGKLGLIGKEIILLSLNEVFPRK
jgi:hypothetical protein